jgi:hypothetical protein
MRPTGILILCSRAKIIAAVFKLVNFIIMNSDPNRDRKPKAQPAPAGGPPRPPKKTARGVEDGSPDDPRRLNAAEQAELMTFLKKSLKK